MMSGWTRTTGNADAGECGSCYGRVWMGTVVVISAVDERISKKINLHIDGWTQMAGAGERGSCGEHGWMGQ